MTIATKRRAGAIAILAVMLAILAIYALRLNGPRWTGAEIATLRSLWIGSLGPPPVDPSNAVADDPRAAALGQRFFFDTRFSSNGAVSCASCHLPELAFQDGLPLGVGVGTTSRRTMPLVGTAYSTWLFWDGRTDSQWAQALGPLESPVEHGGTRLHYAHLIAQSYRADYEAIFGPLPDLSNPARFPPVAGPVDDPAARAAWDRMRPDDREVVTRVYANIGKAIAAYERRLGPEVTPFDRYVGAVLAGDRAPQGLNGEEIAGLRLFIGKGQCVTCHNGPLLTDDAFHNTGVPAVGGLPPDDGRATGARQVRANEFNCLSPYSDAPPEACAELRFLLEGDPRQVRAFKVPSLRGVADRAPYMRAGQIGTLREVLAHYNNAPAAPAGRSELRALNLSPRELAQLEAFLATLTAPPGTPSDLHRPPPR
jgi:cytochrome c peroxidase